MEIILTVFLEFMEFTAYLYDSQLADALAVNSYRHIDKAHCRMITTFILCRPLFKLEIIWNLANTDGIITITDLIMKDTRV